MPFAIRFHQTGGPEVLRAGRRSPSASRRPARRASATKRSGSTTSTPITAAASTRCRCLSGLGTEGAGIVEAVGEGVTDLQVGDRVAYAGGPLGAYSQVRCLPADRLLKLPEAIDCRSGAAMMLQGLTAAYLLRRTYGASRRPRTDPCRRRRRRTESALYEICLNDNPWYSPVHAIARFCNSTPFEYVVDNSYK